jgi:hypothetical protein
VIFFKKKKKKTEKNRSRESKLQQTPKAPLISKKLALWAVMGIWHKQLNIYK